MTASPITSFSFSEKEKEGKRKTAQGVPPRSEPRFAPANRDEIKSRGSMRLRPPRPPGERASRERQPTEMLCTAEKVSVFGQKPLVCRAARHDPNFGFPSEEKPRIVRGRTFNSPRFDLSALCGLYRSFPRSRKKEKNNHPTHHLQSTHIPTNEMYLFFKHHKIRGEIVDFFSKKYYDSLCWQQ